MINRPRLRTSRISTLELKDYLHRKLNLPRCCGGGSQRTRYSVGASSPIENVRIRGVGGGSEVRVIQNVEDFRSELNVESFGNALDVIVLEQGEVHRCNTWANQNVTPCISPKVKAWVRWQPTKPVEIRILRIVDLDRIAVGIRAESGRHRIAVRTPETRIRCCGNLETLRL